MEAKLIKTQEGYTLNDVEGNPIGQTFGKFQGKRLSLKNCQAIERGYDLDELAEKHYDLHIKRGHTEEDSLQRKIDFILGFVSALEILGDKKFSEEQMKRIYEKGYSSGRSELNSRESDKIKYDYIQSLQQTEWDVIVEMEKVYDGLDEMAQPQYVKQSKLDAENCLILKRL